MAKLAMAIWPMARLRLLEKTPVTMPSGPMVNDWRAPMAEPFWVRALTLLGPLNWVSPSAPSKSTAMAAPASHSPGIPVMVTGPVAVLLPVAGSNVTVAGVRVRSVAPERAVMFHSLAVADLVNVTATSVGVPCWSNTVTEVVVAVPSGAWGSRLPPKAASVVAAGAVVWPSGKVRFPMAPLVLIPPSASAIQPRRTEPSGVVRRPRPSKLSEPDRV